jgi:hypothetical protein
VTRSRLAPPVPAVLSRRRALLGAAALTGLLGSACSQPGPPSAKFADITFQQFPKFDFAVSRIEIVREYVAPLSAPNVDHLFPVPPMRMAEQWAHDRLVAAGGPNELRYVIKRASVVEAQLPKTTGIRGAFTNDQTQRYDAVVEVEIEVRNERGYRDGIVSARAERRQSVGDNISVADRERVWFGMTEALGRDLNQELERNIQTGLARFLTFR